MQFAGVTLSAIEEASSGRHSWRIDKYDFVLQRMLDVEFVLLWS